MQLEAQHEQLRLTINQESQGREVSVRFRKGPGGHKEAVF
jgi:hypothetical protein